MTTRLVKIRILVLPEYQHIAQVMLLSIRKYQSKNGVIKHIIYNTKKKRLVNNRSFLNSEQQKICAIIYVITDK